MILTEDIVEPQWGLLEVWQWFVPCKDSVGLAANKSPINSRYIILLQEWEDRLEITTIATRHIFGADHRTVVLA